MKHLSLTAEKRTPHGTGGAIRARAAGFTPAILLGHHETAVPVQVSSSALIRVLREGGRNVVVELDVDGQTTLAMVRNFTRDPISRKIIHVDFQRVSANEAIETAVPIVFVGHSEATDDGGVVAQELMTLPIRAGADRIPGQITVDISDLLPGHPLHVRDLVLPEGVECTMSGDQVVAVVALPRGRALEDELAAAAEEAAAEPAGEEAS